MAEVHDFDLGDLSCGLFILGTASLCLRGKGPQGHMTPEPFHQNLQPERKHIILKDTDGHLLKWFFFRESFQSPSSSPQRIYIYSLIHPVNCFMYKNKTHLNPVNRGQNRPFICSFILFRVCLNEVEHATGVARQ